MFLILIHIFTASFHSVPMENEGVCCKMKENQANEKTASCCLEKNKHSCEDKGCGGKCGDPFCNCPLTDFQISLPPSVLDPGSKFSEVIGKATFYYLNGYFNTNYLDIWQPPRIA
ncbi:MAG: hypothetical protein RLZZ417_1103 [Bacteroidota bacterium]